MQDVISQLAENPAYKILLLEEKEIEILDALSNSKDNVINVAGKMKLQQELALISNLDVMVSMDSGNAHIAAMLGVKLSHFGCYASLCRFSPFHQPLENTLVSDREQYPMLPTSVYGNKIVVGYEDAMRTITQEMVMSVQKQLED
jgi:ADP-heptose:LPS heptosyltransferase